MVRQNKLECLSVRFVSAKYYIWELSGLCDGDSDSDSDSDNGGDSDSDLSQIEQIYVILLKVTEANNPCYCRGRFYRKIRQCKLSLRPPVNLRWSPPLG